jgi:hypothetical protein
MKKNSKDQLNAAREEINSRVAKYLAVGQAKRITWNNKRRFRSI